MTIVYGLIMIVALLGCVALPYVHNRMTSRKPGRDEMFQRLFW